MAEARRVEEIPAQASRRVSSSDVIGARDILAAAEDGAQCPVTFALAETYDPNMLVALGLARCHLRRRPNQGALPQGAGARRHQGQHSARSAEVGSTPWL
jgi:hypothetical protein